MTKPNIVKKHIATSFHNLSPELQEAVKAKYPLGFTDAMIRVDKPYDDEIKGADDIQGDDDSSDASDASDDDVNI